MIELMVKHESAGLFRVTSRQDWEQAHDEIPIGCELRAEFKFPRSSPENRLVHGAIKSAYDNQRGGPMFSEEEGGWKRLRAWLLCEAGHCDLLEFSPGSISPEVIRALKQRDQESFWSADAKTGVIRLRIPKTIRFSVVKHPDFQPVKTKMLDLLCNVICPGTTPEQLMEQRYTRPKLTRKKVKNDERGAQIEQGRAAAEQQERTDRTVETAGGAVP